MESQSSIQSAPTGPTPLPLHLSKGNRRRRPRHPCRPQRPAGSNWSRPPPSPQPGPKPPALSPSSRPETETRGMGLLPPVSICSPWKFFEKFSGVTRGQPSLVRRCPRERRAKGMVKLMKSKCHDCASRTVPPGDEVNYWKKKCCHLCLSRLGTNPRRQIDPAP
jgi:hypothetical protein